jgi:hypothetical protein
MIYDLESKVAKVYLSFFNLYRVLDADYTFSLKTITSPDQSESIDWSYWMKHFLKTFVYKYISEYRANPLRGVIPEPFPLYKSSPNSLGAFSESATSYNSVMRSAYAVLRFLESLVQKESIAPKGKAMSILSASQPRISRILDLFGPRLREILSIVSVLNHNMQSEKDGSIPESINLKDFKEDWQFLKPWELMFFRKPAKVWKNSGKLGFKEEAAGKLRVFALVDCFTQWALKPLHL